MKLIKELREGITQHGFRSSFRDWSADCTNFSRLVCEHALAHRLKDKAEASYLRSTQFQKRRKLMSAWADYCDVIQAKQTSNVTGINAGASA
jgi:hypothetical protein